MWTLFLLDQIIMVYIGLPSPQGILIFYGKMQHNIVLCEHLLTNVDTKYGAYDIGETGDSCNIFTCQAIALKILYY